jgi:PhnB protein
MTNGFSPVPEGFHTVTPYLMVSDVDTLVEFMSHAFGVEEVFRARGARSGLHVEVRVGDSMVMIGGLPRGEPQPAAIFLYMDGVDEVYRRALEAGASSIEVPADRPSDGDRRAAFTDPFGNAWFVAARIEDVSRAELQKRRDDLAQRRADPRSKRPSCSRVGLTNVAWQQIVPLLPKNGRKDKH